ncbi:type II secretion system protein GspC, partial [Klebsiella michiganensis]
SLISAAVINNQAVGENSDDFRLSARRAIANPQANLLIGDSTPGGEAKIVAIFPDRLIVNYRGRNEAIPLFNDP